MGCNLLAGGAPCSQKKCSVCNEAVILVRTSDPGQPINMEHTVLQYYREELALLSGMSQAVYTFVLCDTNKEKDKIIPKFGFQDQFNRPLVRTGVLNSKQ